MGCISLKKFLHSKRNKQQSEERSYRMGKIVSYNLDRRLVSTIYFKTQKIHEKHSTLLTIRQMQMKRILRFHLIPEIMAITKTSNMILIMLVRLWWKGSHSPLLVEIKSVQPLWKPVLRFSKSLKTEIAFYLAILLLGIFLDELKTS